MHELDFGFIFSLAAAAAAAAAAVSVAAVDAAAETAYTFNTYYERLWLSSRRSRSPVPREIQATVYVFQKVKKKRKKRKKKKGSHPRF